MERSKAYGSFIFTQRHLTMRKGNYAIGERNGRARGKATDDDVVLALELHRTGMSAAEIARKFEFPERTVRNWCAGVCRG